MTTKKVLFDKYFQFFVNVTQRCRLHSPLSVTHTLYNTQGNIYSMYMITALLYYTYFLDIISLCDVLYMFTLFTVLMAIYSMFRCRYRTVEAISAPQRMAWVTQRSKSLF
jgi:hypothetical protein